MQRRAHPSPSKNVSFSETPEMRTMQISIVDKPMK
jgi:hypothetical protein